MPEVGSIPSAGLRTEPLPTYVEASDIYGIK
jgi:hypothetical protein